MVGLIKDGRQVFRSFGQMGSSQLPANPALWIVTFKGKGVLAFGCQAEEGIL